MSDFALTQIAQAYASKEVEEFIKEYNSEENQELTQEGKRELINYLVFRAYIAGFRLSEDSKCEKQPCPSCY